MAILTMPEHGQDARGTSSPSIEPRYSRLPGQWANLTNFKFAYSL